MRLAAITTVINRRLARVELAAVTEIMGTAVSVRGVYSPSMLPCPCTSFSLADNPRPANDGRTDGSPGRWQSTLKRLHLLQGKSKQIDASPGN
ncbi:MAG: hypothetical protein AAF664_18685 [Planctomycetota bacterium]